MMISVVIPTMNEEESIGEVLDSIIEALEPSEFDFEMMIVDTNSKDRTREIAGSKGARIIDEPRRGYGRAYKTGFESADGEIIATLDADCTYPAEDIPALARTLLSENLDFITTNRFARPEEGAMSSSHRFGNNMLTFTLNLLFGMGIKDSQSGMWVFRKSSLEKFDLTDDGMPLSEEIKIEAFRKVKAREIPITYRKRKGEVKLSSWKDGRKNFAFLWKKKFS
ncbi:MAG: glycosyltransferase family 2 protein [Methanomassiliicoccales archaeon]|nr:glycosyltransferase family 2 protein [Methanomassiliicoccales archaeon]